MRIPKFAFALLVVSIVLLGSGLAVVRARQRTQGTVLMLTIKSDRGETTRCALPTEYGNLGGCFFMHLVNVGGTNSSASFGQLNSAFRVIENDGNRFQIGARLEFVSKSKVGSESTYKFSPSVLDNVPEKTYWFEPGDKLEINVPGMGTVEVTGKALDHMPSIVTSENEEEPLDPKEGEIRVVSPVLLKGNERLVDVEGFTGRAEGNDAIFVYAPRVGRFLLLPSRVVGAVQGEIRQSRIAFEIGADSYQFLMAAPIARSQNIWVLYQPNYKPSLESPDQSDDQASAGTMDKNRLIPAAN